MFCSTGAGAVVGNADSGGNDVPVELGAIVSTGADEAVDDGTVAGGAVVGATVVGATVDVCASAINSSNSFSSFRCAWASRMPVPQSW